jgi:hypothetical protein
VNGLKWRVVLAHALLGLMLASTTPARAESGKVVSGLIVNFGIIPAEVALQASGHSEAHPAHPPPGSQHLLVTIDDARSDKRMGDADVTIELTGPKGYVERKPLLHTHGGGFPDYSELFVLRTSGKYSARVIIKQAPSAPPIETRFDINHVI